MYSPIQAPSEIRAHLEGLAAAAGAAAYVAPLAGKETGLPTASQIRVRRERQGRAVAAARTKYAGQVAAKPYVQYTEDDIRDRTRQIAGELHSLAMRGMLNPDAAHFGKVARGQSRPAKTMRLTSERFWRRHLRETVKHEVAAFEMAVGMAGRNRKPIGAQSVHLREQQKRRTAEMMSETFISDGEVTLALADVWAKSQANPQNRLFDLKVRLRGMAEYALARGLTAHMFTVTCPSRMHASSAKYDGTTPKEAQQHLTTQWARMRAVLKKLEKEGLIAFGGRHVEHHSDGCPHWHLLTFTNNADRLEELFRRYFLLYEGLDGGEPGAETHRVRRDDVRAAHGANSVIAYVLPYMLKGLGGKANDVEGKSADEDTLRDGTIAEAATTHDAWRSAWRIPGWKLWAYGVQLPTAGVWREARRIDKDEENPGFVALRAANLEQNYLAFIGAFVAHGGRQAIKLVRREDRLDAYGDVVPGRILGIEVSGDIAVTRIKEWRRVARPEAAPASANEVSREAVTVVVAEPRKCESSQEPAGTERSGCKRPVSVRPGPSFDRAARDLFGLVEDRDGEATNNDPPWVSIPPPREPSDLAECTWVNDLGTALREPTRIRLKAKATQTAGAFA